MAIRQNTKTVPEMRKAVSAVLYHCSESSSEETRRLYCPKDKATWCKWQNDKLTGENKYKEKVSIPKAIKETLLRIFKDLSDPQLLEKCLHGQTQNVNESLNGIIWQNCPKNLLVSRQLLEIGASSAVLQYNDGAGAIINVMKRLSVEPGTFFYQGSIGKNDKRIKASTVKSSETGKKRRKQLRATAKGYIDKENEEEGETYKSGAF